MTCVGPTTLRIATTTTGLLVALPTEVTWAKTATSPVTRGITDGSPTAAASPAVVGRRRPLALDARTAGSRRRSSTQGRGRAPRHPRHAPVLGPVMTETRMTPAKAT